MYIPSFEKLKTKAVFEKTTMYSLTHWGRVTHICISKPTTIGLDNGLLPGWRQAIIYLIQCWNIVYWTLGNKLEWNLKRNSYIFIQEKAFENVTWKIPAILSRPQCVNVTLHGDQIYGLHHSASYTPGYYFKLALAQQWSSERWWHVTMEVTSMSI